MRLQAYLICVLLLKTILNCLIYSICLESELSGWLAGQLAVWLYMMQCNQANQARGRGERRGRRQIQQVCTNKQSQSWGKKNKKKNKLQMGGSFCQSQIICTIQYVIKQLLLLMQSFYHCLCLEGKPWSAHFHLPYDISNMTYDI